MEVIRHIIENCTVAEMPFGSCHIGSAQEGVELLMNVYYDGYSALIIHKKDLSPEFFDLHTGFAGELLQKFSNYRMRLAVVGDFSDIMAKSLRDFITESNEKRQIVFVGDVNEALQKFSQRS